MRRFPTRTATGTTTRPRLALVAAVCCLTSGVPMAFGAWAGPLGENAPDAGAFVAGAGTENPFDLLTKCERAGIVAEQASGLPPGLLLAIGRVESGRWDNARGRMTPWPWTINAAGRGQWFETKEAAGQTVRTLLGGGTRSIDVGCFQVSLLWHPSAFSSLEQAFDPDANAGYAARFLLILFSQTGTWEAAVEAYHSSNPALGFAYRQQVFSTWLAAAPVTMAAARLPARAAGTPAPGAAPFPTPAAMPVVMAGVRIWTPLPAGTAATVVAMPGTPGPYSPGGDAPGDASGASISRASGAAYSVPLPVVSYRAWPLGVTPRR
jgi:hypothetical protein